MRGSRRTVGHRKMRRERPCLRLGLFHCHCGLCHLQPSSAVGKKQFWGALIEAKAQRCFETYIRSTRRLTVRLDFYVGRRSLSQTNCFWKGNGVYQRLQPLFCLVASAPGSATITYMKQLSTGR
jgi:hypothetical protein